MNESRRLLPKQVAWWTYLVWIFAGALTGVCALGMNSLGWYVIVFPAVLVGLLSFFRSTQNRAFIAGLAGLASIPVSYAMQYRNSIDGMVCRILNSTTCVQFWAPWSFIVMAAVWLLVCGLVLLLLNRRVKQATLELLKTGENQGNVESDIDWTAFDLVSETPAEAPPASFEIDTKPLEIARPIIDPLPEPTIKQPVLQPEPVIRHPEIKQPVVKQPEIKQSEPVVKHPEIKQPEPAIKPTVLQPEPAVQHPEVKLKPVVKHPEIKQPEPVVQRPEPKPAELAQPAASQIAPPEPIVVKQPKIKKFTFTGPRKKKPETVLATETAPEPTKPAKFESEPTEKESAEIVPDTPTTVFPTVGTPKPQTPAGLDAPTGSLVFESTGAQPPSKERQLFSPAPTSAPVKPAASDYRPGSQLAPSSGLSSKDSVASRDIPELVPPTAPKAERPTAAPQTPLTQTPAASFQPATSTPRPADPRPPRDYPTAGDSSAMDLVSSIFDSAAYPNLPAPKPRTTRTSGTQPTSSGRSPASRSVQDSFEAALEEEMGKLRNLSKEMKTNSPVSGKPKPATGGFDEIEENLRQMRQLFKHDDQADQ